MDARSPARTLVSLLTLLCAGLFLAAGCHRGSSTDATEDATQRKLDLTYTNDAGVAVASYQVGEPVFVSVNGLKPRALHTVRLNGPVAPSRGAAGSAPAPASAASSPPRSAPEASPAAGPRPPGPSEGAQPAPAGRDEPALYAQPAADAEGSTADSPSVPVLPNEAGDTAAPEAPVMGTAPPEEGQTDDAAQRPGGPAEEPVPSRRVEPTPSATSTETGSLVTSGKYLTDGDGTLGAVQVARSIGLSNGNGPGLYTVTVSDDAGTELGRSTIEVVEGTGPLVHASDATGRQSLRFIMGQDSVWITARRLPPNADVPCFVVEDKTQWAPGTSLDPANGRVAEARTDATGRTTIEIWAAPDRAGAFDVVLDLDNDGTYSTGDVVTGVRTTGFVVAEQPLVAEEVDLVTALACGADYYQTGHRGELTSAEGLFVRGLPLVHGQREPSGGTVYVCTHSDRWEPGTGLASRVRQRVQLNGGDPTGLPRTLVWPAPVLPGAYDIVVDVDGDGRYTRGVDLLDNFSAGPAGLVVSDAGNLVTVRGKVTNERGEPISGAVVACEDSGQGQVTTGEGGEFAIAQVLPLPTRLLVNATGYLPTEQPISPSPEETAVTVPDIRLAASAGAGLAYFPLADGGEWKYKLDRTISRTLTIGSVTSTEGTTETGHIVRGVVATQGGGYTVTERETVFVESPNADTTGETIRERTVALEMGADGIRRSGERAGLLFPATPRAGEPLVVGPFDIGGYLVSGQAVLDPGGPVSTDAGEFAACMLLKLTVTFGYSLETGDTTATGTVRTWLAPDVGEVRREAEFSLDVVGVTDAGESRSGDIAVKETLSLVNVSL